MRIRMTKLAAGPDGVRRPGEIHDLADAEAQPLVAGGYAAVAPPMETTTIAAPENAAKRTKRARPRKVGSKGVSKTTG